MTLINNIRSYRAPIGRGARTNPNPLPEAILEKHIIASEQGRDDRLNKIESLINSQNSKIDSMTDKVSKRLTNDKKYRHTISIIIALGVIATVVAMIGIYYATVSMITDIVGVTIK